MSLHADPPPRIVREPTGVQYITSDRLGKGGFAICHRAEECKGPTPTGKTVALKIVRSKMEPQKLAQKFVTELQLHSKLRHPNIVEFYRAFSFEQSTYVVLEICENGSLGDALKKRKFFTMPEIRRFLIQICGAVKYLHYRSIVHRDLKTGNIFLDANMNVKVGDFGLAAVLVGKNDIGLRRTTMCGTPNYLAPEILEKTGKGHNEKVDLWAIGIIAYTLAVGKAPFHAAKREEIYKNLQTRSYDWPDLAQHPNNISRDLQDLVGSLLVDEDDRPCPDRIVSHSYFKMAFIPEELRSILTSMAPTWPSPHPPTTEVMRRGYSDIWFKLCQECGVGEYAPGRTFPVVGNTNTSIVREVEKEIKAGKAPTVPMPQTMVYMARVFDKKDRAMGKTTNLSQISEESSGHSSVNQVSKLMEITGNERSTVAHARQSRAIKTQTLGATKENIPPPSPPEQPVTVVTEQPKPPRPESTLRRARSARAKPLTQYHGTLKSNKSIECMSRSAYASQTVGEPRELTTSLRSEAKLRLASRELQREPQLQPQLQEPQIQTEANSGNIVPRPSEESSKRPSQEPPLRPRARSRTVSRDDGLPKSRSLTAASRDDGTAKSRNITTVSHDEAISKSRQSNTKEMSSRAKVGGMEFPGQALVDTDPATVLAMAYRLRNNVLVTLAGRSGTIRSSSSSSKEQTPRLPFVTKWVDYAKKHGIGYVLSDGTVGTMFNASKDLPVRHVVVRNGPNYVQKISSEKPMVMSEVPFEFYTTGSIDSIKPMVLTAAQKRMNGLLWAKFGRYMCSSLSNTSEATFSEKYGERDGVIVRYYQRLGNVGVWGFSNGCFQINFPDHTKLVVGKDGKHCAFICLPLDGLLHLQSKGKIPIEFVKSRVLLSGPMSSLLNGTEERPLTKANQLRQKLQYVSSLLTIWIEGGGLGCKLPGEKWPRWTGPQLDDQVYSTVDWIIVGKTGDEECVVVEAAPTD